MNSKKNLKRNLLICLLAGSAVMYTLPLHAATSVIGNGTLPQNGRFVGDDAAGSIKQKGDLQLDVSQKYQNAVIKWDSFDVGGSATVNFSAEGAYANNFNTLNYINSGAASQIYGTINAQGGKIFIVNPAGVQIGNSAQINVGSLYVSNKNLDDAINKLFKDVENDGNIYQNINLAELMNNGTTTEAVLMNLGNINANKVTFEGDGRIIIDSERLKDVEGTEKLTADKIFVNTKDENNLVIGYDGYDENKNNGSYNIASDSKYIATVNNTVFAQNKGYMWVEDVNQLQAIGENANTLSGNYALRNSIDATSTATDTFISIGDHNNEFTGKFDGLDYSIFELNIDSSGKDYAGLFGVTDGAVINNVTIVGGNISGGSSVGAVVGYAKDTTISNVINSASVTGDAEVGGIVGTATGSTITTAVNTGTVHSNGESDGQGGTVSNVGGLIGYMYNGTLNGNSYNLGDASGDGYNVGGLVGSASNSTIGDGTNLVYNRMDVTGAYNVGGIVGNMEGSTVQNAENSGTVSATGDTTGEYTFHTDNTANGYSNGVSKTVNVNVANVGGIAGKADDTVNNVSKIENVTNTGNVSSSKQENNNYYDAGNVGGIVGSALDTNITNATNRENEVRGAHNVGGVAGYFGNSNDAKDAPDYTITNGINDGGDIMATGARFNNNFVKEIIRPASDRQTEEFIIGNIGGVVGYMDGDNVYVTGSANRGTVHTSEPNDPENVQDYEKAANVGGIVGKIDRSDTLELSDLNGEKGKITNAAVSNSYNTGDVLGYTGVGGVVGMMYNGEVAGSYNLGYIRTTRQSSVGINSIDSLNMGGIVGDTTENSDAKALLYDVYNKGQIGDEKFEYFGRHVGGIVGRLSGSVVKAYNTGAIYNGYNVVGGIAGWVFEGSINNAFNTGNITVYNKNSHSSQVGGIVGAAQGGHNIVINNVYNLGTLRSFDIGYGDNSLGGILGTATQKGTVTISNAYTTGNLYAGTSNNSGNEFIEDISNNNVNSIYGSLEYNAKVDTQHNTYYIKPAYENGQPLFTVLTGDRDNSSQSVDFSNKSDYEYVFDGGITNPDKTTGVVDEDSAWRIYGGNTPILNAFLPKAEDYFSGESGISNAMNGIDSIQYGTAYDPLLTIINAANGTNQLKYEWDKLGISNAAGLVVYGAGLTLNDFKAYGATGYFGGTIYTDGALNINGNTNDIGIGSAADIYGSAVNLTTDGKVTIYGNITATGNTTNGVDNSDMTVEDAGNITINAGDVDVYGTLTTATTADYGNDVKIPGIEGTAVTWNPGNVSDPYAEMSDIADRFAHTTGKSNVNGNITINAGKDEDGNAIGGGNVNIYFGNQEQGLITTGGDLQVEATGNIFVDSDLDVGGNLKLTSTGKNSEILLTLTNIGKVQADKFTGVIENFLNGKNIADINANDLLNVIQEAYPGVEFTNAYAERIVAALTKYEESGNKASAIEQLNNDIAVAYMHQFMHNFDKTVEGSNKIYFNADSGNAKLTVDMWDYGNNEYDFEKYDTKFDEHGTEHTFKDELDNLDLHVNNDTAGVHANASEYVYVEVSNGAQLKAIQQAGADALAYNYALMGDINASGVSGYEAIGAGSANNGFTGTFDGRGNRIIGLTVDGKDNANAGIFDTIGTNGVVKDVNIYSGNFTGTAKAGAVAGENNGRIEGVVTFGNTVTVTGEGGNAGGIVGVNNGNNGKIVTNEDGTITLEPVDDELPVTGIIDVESTGSVIAGGSSAVAGGLVGTNDGALGNSYSNSAVTANKGTGSGLGGVVGVNTANGNVQYVDSLGVTNGGAHLSNNVGGIIGINNGNMYSGYNESIVSGKDKVGGIIGENSTGGTVTNIVNATSVTGENESADNVSQYVGGLVGSNSGSVTNGRNNGTITGTNYVGGMVGNNAQRATLTNLVNDSSAEILGENYVGGIAGSNAGKITADKENDNLVNRGSITGNKFVGGVAGVNEFGGTIANTLNSVVLHAKGENAQYFGGVVGQNSGEINGATNTSNIDITAVGGSYVGGIIGQNTKSGTLKGEIRNEGSVAGKSQVGGIIGENDNDYVLIGTEGNRLTVENDGSVDAQEGGAAGIFYENHGEIKYADISNSGVVNGGDKEGGTGGLFGINTGNITESTLTNSGTVIGGGIVGGLIGKNSGDAFNSSLTNTGSVIGKSDVGGLIGYNTGTVTGGRNKAQETDKDGKVTAEKDSYYKYQIYNNGVVNVGTWNDKNSNGKVDDGEITGLQQGETSQNIGGLIGNNADEIATGGKKGSLTAGYNTGVINASGSTTVGGIAGSNSGTIDQVFNTVYNTDGTKGAITGGTNVGGLVGANSGMLSNAYNTTDVFGNSVFGNAVGNNTAKGTIKNIYASNNSGKLIGENINQSVDAIQNAYSFVNGDTSATKIISGEDQKDSGSYDGFDFSAADVDGDVADWKNYDGYSNPLLKVFLTKAKYTGNESFTYNGQDQGLTINGNVSAADKLDAYNNANSLLQATQNKNAGQDYLGIYSQQIAASGSGDTFNPNNLGYDIDVTYDIDKATITINLDEISRDYGNSAINNVTSGGNNYGFNFGNMVLTDEMKADLTADNLGFTQTSDGAVDNLKGGQKTNNADTYNWYANFKLSDALSANYQFDTQGADSLTSVKGVSKVNQVQLTIDLKDITRVYGNLDKADYEFIAKGLVNGDNIEDLILTVTADGAIVEGSTDNPLKTNVVGDYEWSATVSNISNNLNTNYIIKIDASAKSTVTPAQLDVVLGDVSHVYGSPNLDDYKASFGNNELVNGDSGNISINVVSVTDEALSTDKQYTNDVDNYHWTVGEGGLSANGFDLGNYTVHYVDKGNSKVTPAQLDVVLGDVSHVYGSPNLNGYAASFGNNNRLVNGDSGSISVNVGSVTDDALSTDKQYTNDVDNYHWTVGEGGLSADGFKLGNYAINFVNEGSSKVTKANLTININDVNMTYGDLENWISGQYGYNASDIDGQTLVNGDSLADVIADMTYNNTAYNSDGTTKNVAESNFFLTSDGVTQGTKYGNYNITFNNGTVTMNKKQITIGANDEQILVGETPNYSGTDIDGMLVNGDSLNDNYHYGVADGSIESVTGTHNGAIGVWIGGSFYDLSNPDWSNLPGMSFFANYNVTFEPGTLTVSAYDIPEDWPHNRWDYLFNDAPFDRNKDFRERKAEVNFVDGGMEI